MDKLKYHQDRNHLVTQSGDNTLLPTEPCDSDQENNDGTVRTSSDYANKNQLSAGDQTPAPMLSAFERIFTDTPFRNMPENSLNQSFRSGSGGKTTSNTSSAPPSANTSSTTSTSAGPAQSNTESYGIKEVFGYNLEEEMRKINKLVRKFPFIAIDTEFPGVVARPCGVFNTNSEFEYALFKVNVDLMKIIQLGLSFFDENGKQPQPIHTWQFNFRFSLAEEMYAQDSIKLLMHSGIQFPLHESMGIEPDHFAERLITSNILCNDRVRFLTFHSAYDFGYLLKVLEGTECLPKTESTFLEKLKMYLPHIYDIKFMIRDQRTLKGGLQDLANQFHLQRVGSQHQAGSDSALTGALFFRLREEVFHGKLDEFSGRLFGLTGSFGDRVHHLENVVIKENVKTGNSNANTASPVKGIISGISLTEDTSESESKTSSSAPSSTHTNTHPHIATSSSSAQSQQSQTPTQQLHSSNLSINTFTVLTNVNIPNRFYEESAGYVVASTTSSGEYVVSNDPSIVQQQQQHVYSTAGSSYYGESNGYT